MQMASATLSEHKTHLVIYEYGSTSWVGILIPKIVDCYEILIAVLSQGNTSILVMILHLTIITCIFVMIVD